MVTFHYWIIAFHLLKKLVHFRKKITRRATPNPKISTIVIIVINIIISKTCILNMITFFPSLLSVLCKCLSLWAFNYQPIVSVFLGLFILHFCSCCNHDDVRHCTNFLSIFVRINTSHFGLTFCKSTCNMMYIKITTSLKCSSLFSQFNFEIDR